MSIDENGLNADSVSILGAGSGGVIFSSGAAGTLATHQALTYDPANANLSASNVYVDARAHANQVVVGGPSGNARFRMSVSSNELVVSRINPDGTETAYVNFSDLVRLLSKVSVV